MRNVILSPYRNHALLLLLIVSCSSIIGKCECRIVTPASFGIQSSVRDNLSILRGGAVGQNKLLTSSSSLSSSSSIQSLKGGSTENEEHLMSPITAISNVLADLCPHGMLPLAYGIAAGGGTGPVLASLILIIFGFLSWYSLISFARAAQVIICEKKSNKSSSSTSEEGEGESISAVWRKTVPNGDVTSWIPDAGCALLTLGCLLFYSAFIGDLFSSLSKGLLSSSTTSTLSSLLQKRYVSLLVLHLVPVLPLCLLRDLSALKYSSAIGLAGIIYSTLFVGRRMMDGTYAEGGNFHASMAQHLRPAIQPTFPGDTASKIGSYLFHIPSLHAGKGLLTLMNMCCVAFACHYNSVKYYLELKDRTVPKFGQVMGLGIGGTGLVFLAMMILGYGTFGANAQALLLNNYHTKDPYANAARFFTGVAILSGYPLMFAGLKSAIFSLTGLDQTHVPNREAKQNQLSVVILAIIAIAACFVTEHELATVIGIVGSIFGSVVIYMFPALVSNGLLKKKEYDVQPFFRGEQLFNSVLFLFGIVFAILGTWVTLNE
mmetsp:Transcript_14678/g.20953  ORF Transcript_14678/g.20953 Transcript_14678/m.20953 type:complete len:546 (-) Transcript_14678:167-1804(-)